MALLTEESIEGRATRRQALRTCNVSSRLTRREAIGLDALAERRGVQRGELIRQLIRDELDREAGMQTADPVLVEVTGLRLMLANLLKPIALGQRMTPELFDAILTEVRRSKREVATTTQTDSER
jgi:hypothetical protein